MHVDYRPDIDGLRAIAVLAVVAFHVAPMRVTGGFVGVDIFFVISGFLISSIIISGVKASTFSYINFYVRRIRRIFPALALVFAFSLLAGWFLLLPDEYEQLGRHVVAGSLFVSNLQLWSEAGYFDAASGLKPLLHLWSLGIEEQFYIVWPLLLALIWKRSTSAVRWIAVGITVSFAICLLLSVEHPTAAFYLPVARFWQLLIGAGLAALAARKQSSAALAADPQSPAVRRVPAWLSHGCSWAGLVLILVSITSIDSQTLYPTIRALVPTIGAALLIAAGPRAHVNKYLLSLKPVVYVGLVSYPFYLWHWPLLSFLEIVQPPGPMPAYKLAAAGASFVLAVGTYLIVEKRVRTPPYVRLEWIVLASITCMVLGLAVVVREGFIEERGPWGIKTTPARFERSLMQTPECITEFGKLFMPHVIEGRDFCVLNPATRPVVRVLGDSHANRLFLGLQDIDTSRNYQNLGRGTCLPFVGFDGAWPDTGEELMCKETNQNLVNDSAQMKGDIVIVHGFFIRAYRGGLKLSGSQGAREQAHLTFGLLAKGHKHVVLVLDVPELPFELPSCVTRPILKGFARKKCSFAARDWEARSAVINGELRAAASEFSDVTVFDPASVLCDADECYAQRNGELLYTDGHHLSRAGATLVGAELRKVLDRISPVP